MRRNPIATRKASPYSQPSYLSREEFIKLFYSTKYCHCETALLPSRQSHINCETIFLLALRLRSSPRSSLRSARNTSLRHLIDAHTSLLIDQFERSIEFIFIDTIGGAFQIANINVADMILIDNLLSRCPIGSGVESFNICLTRSLQSIVAPLTFMPGPSQNCRQACERGDAGILAVLSADRFCHNARFEPAHELKCLVIVGHSCGKIGRTIQRSLLRIICFEIIGFAGNAEDRINKSQADHNDDHYGVNRRCQPAQL